MSADLKIPFPVREVLARVVDDSEFDEFKPRYGPNLVTGFAHLHGYSIGILANDRGVLLNEDANKAAQFIQLANQVDTPLLFVQNVTGYMVGTDYEQRGMVKHGSHQINAVTNSTVPHLTVQIGSSYGAGQLRHGRPAVQPPFPVRLAERQDCGHGSRAAGRHPVARGQGLGRRPWPRFDEEADAARTRAIEDQITNEERAASCRASSTTMA